MYQQPSKKVRKSLDFYLFVCYNWLTLIIMLEVDFWNPLLNLYKEFVMSGKKVVTSCEKEIREIVGNDIFKLGYGYNRILYRTIYYDYMTKQLRKKYL